MVIDNAAQFAATRVTIDVSWDKSNILIKVSDDGPGFKTAILNRLGQPYNSSRAGVNGHMGLGLFISSTMIEGLGGRLEVSNVKLGGAMVTFILPRASVDVGWKV
jgi:two-component system sensor histidine kinase RegB